MCVCVRACVCVCVCVRVCVCVCVSHTGICKIFVVLHLWVFPRRGRLKPRFSHGRVDLDAAPFKDQQLVPGGGRGFEHLALGFLVDTSITRHGTGARQLALI